MRTPTPVTNDCSHRDPFLQPRSLNIAKRRTRVRQILRFCSDICLEPSWNSTQPPETHQRVEVIGSCLLIDLISLMLRWFLIFFLVLRAVNVPTLKKYRFLKRRLFVTVSNPETTAKTTDVPVERQIAKWNQNLDPL